MVCPRCDRARIERAGLNTRCAICGMSYDPNQPGPVPSPQEETALSKWRVPDSLPLSVQPVLQSVG
jgi:hypothetical protein